MIFPLLPRLYFYLCLYLCFSVSLCLCFRFSSRLIVLVKLASVEDEGWSEKISSSASQRWSRWSEGFSGREVRILPSRQVLGIAIEASAVKVGSGLCHKGKRKAGRVDRVTAQHRRRVGLAVGGGARVGQDGWQYGASTKSGLLECGTAAVSSRRHGQPSCLSGPLSSGGLETGGTPARERSWCWIVGISLACQI